MAKRTLSQVRSHDIEAARGVADDEHSLSTENESINKQLETSRAYGATERGDTKASRIAVVQGLKRPLFHVDVTAALNSALANVRMKNH